jgi:predicted transposase/invertase (TIGR01784 family)
VETQLSLELDNASYDARYDRHCKNLLAHREILAHIIKECVEEFKDFDVKYIADNCIEGTPQISELSVHRGGKPKKIIGANTEDKTQDEGTVFFDIRFVAILPQTGVNIRLIINIEAQNKYNPGYSIIRRGLYYCCRLVSAQYETEFARDDYDNIKKVYSIWICTDTPKYAKNTITKYCISEKNIIGGMKADPKKYDILNLIMVCLDEDSEDSANKGEGILKLLRVLLSGEVNIEKKKLVLNGDFDVEINAKIEKELNDMCNLSAGIRDKALRQGIEQGYEKGVEHGVEQGFEIKQLEDLKKLIKNLHFTFEQAADALELSTEARERFAAMI